MKLLPILAGTALFVILGVQQYQLDRITTDVASVKEDIKFIAQSTGTPVSYSAKDEDCLAKNIYYEAGVEGEKGKYSVAQVTLNRLKTGRWGNSVCAVVYAKSQFSWTLKKKLEKPSGQSWADSQWIAHRVLRGEYVPSLQSAMYYHAAYVKPAWRDPVAKIKQVGQHIFYARAKTKSEVRG
jgi:spore germination cell wall hydrolase CwlJ-like protein